MALAGCHDLWELQQLAEVNDVALPDDTKLLLSCLSTMGLEGALIHFATDLSDQPSHDKLFVQTGSPRGSSAGSQDTLEPTWSVSVQQGLPHEAVNQDELFDAMLFSSQSVKEEKVKQLQEQMVGCDSKEQIPLVVAIPAGCEEQNIYSGQMYVFNFKLVADVGRLSLTVESDCSELHVQPSALTLDVSASPVYISVSVCVPKPCVAGVSTLTISGTVELALQITFQPQPQVTQLRAHQELKAPEGPWPLLRWDQQGAPELVEATLQKFEELPPLPVSIISVAGAYRQGKSHLLNQLAKALGMGFDLGHTTLGHTEGFDCMLMQHWEREELVVIVDTEGTDDVAKDDQRTTYILVLAWLFSSTFVYNTLQVPDRQKGDILQAAAFLAQEVRRSSLSGEVSQTEDYPSLTWVVRDWALELPQGKDLENYLEDLLPRRGASTATKQARREADDNVQLLKQLFPRRQMLTVVRPVTDELDLQQLENPEVQRRVKPLFNQQIQEACDAIRAQSQPKRVAGTVLTSPVMVQYFREVVKAVKNGEALTIENTWTRVQHVLGEKGFRLSQEVFDQQFLADIGEFKSKLQGCRFCKGDVPLEEDELEQSAKEAEGNAQQRLLELTRGCEHSCQEAAKHKLSQHVGRKLQQLKHENRELSERFCSSVADQVCSTLRKALVSDQREDIEMLEDYLAIAADEYRLNARGPAKCQTGQKEMEQLHREVSLKQHAQQKLEQQQQEVSHLAMLQEAEHLKELELKDLARRDAQHELRELERQLQAMTEQQHRLAQESRTQQQRFERQMAQQQQQNAAERRRQQEQLGRELARQQQDMSQQVERLMDEQRGKEAQMRQLRAEVTRLENRPPTVVRESSGCVVA